MLIPQLGKFRGATPETCEIFSFNEKGTKIQSVETKEIILDFFINDFGQFFFFVILKEFLNFFPKKKLHRNLFKFEKKSEYSPNLFILRGKMFVFLQIDGKYLIKISKFRD